MADVKVTPMTQPSTTAANALFSTIDTAVRPAGMLPDLSRIIAQFARSIRWTEDQRFEFDVDGVRVALNGGDYLNPYKLPWTALDAPLRDMPIVSVDSSERRHVRVWTIRVDCAFTSIFIGVVKPSSDPAYDANSDRDTYVLGTHLGNFFRGEKLLGGPPVPCTVVGQNADGASYRFTADLTAGTVRVVPTIVRTLRLLSAQPGWFLPRALPIWQSIAWEWDCHPLRAVQCCLSERDAGHSSPSLTPFVSCLSSCAVRWPM
jgi:hypothetical protein